MRRSSSSETFNTSREIALSFPLVVLLPLFLVAVTLTGIRSEAQSQSQSQVRAVRLSDVEGSVQILRGDQTQFEQAFPNMPVMQGSRLQTGNDGRAEVQFEDGAVARLTPNSSLNFNELSRAAGGGTINQLEVLSGLAYFEVGADRKQQYSIIFGRNVVTPNETSTLRVDLDVNPAEVVVLQGNVQVVNSSGPSVNVRTGETIRFDADDTRYFLASGAEPESWDQWNIDRDQALASMAARETAINGVGDQSGAGWSDLDQYGDWYSVPQYGNVWAPRGVDLTWDPYGSGYWAFYPGYGYVWVSANPWGWLPYHCGNWDYFDGFGWGWLPGNCSSAWLTDINIWNAPGYYVKPQRPHPVGPHDNLPGKGNLIAVNRGGSGGLGSARGGLLHPGSPRTFLAGGQVIKPLPKALVSQPSPRIQLAGPTSPVRLPAEADSRYRAVASPQDPQTGRKGSEEGSTPHKVEYNGVVVAPSVSEEMLQDGFNPYYVAPGAPLRPGYIDPGGSRNGYNSTAPGPRQVQSGSMPAPRQAPPAYSAPPRQQAPPSYAPAPHYEAPARSSPPPESHSSPAPAPAPAPAGKK